MKKVVLLGDSIRMMGYGPLVPEMLGEGYEVWQPEDNCRFAAYTLRMLFDYRKSIEGADVIHWNNGLWDTCDLFGDGAFTPVEIYAEQLRRIAGILKSYAPKVIFATTTVPHPDMCGHTWERIQAFNAAARAVLEPMGILINDLYPLVANEHYEELLLGDLIHLSDKGAQVVATQVAEAIRAAVEPQ